MESADWRWEAEDMLYAGERTPTGSDGEAEGSPPPGASPAPPLSPASASFPVEALELDGPSSLCLCDGAPADTSPGATGRPAPSLLAISCVMVHLRGMDDSPPPQEVSLRFPPPRAGGLEYNGRLLDGGEDLQLLLKRDRAGAYISTECVRTDMPLAFELCCEMGRCVYGRIERAAPEATEAEAFTAAGGPPEAGWALALSATPLAGTTSGPAAPPLDVSPGSAGEAEMCLVGIGAGRPVCISRRTHLLRRRRSLLAPPKRPPPALEVIEEDAVKPLPLPAYGPLLTRAGSMKQEATDPGVASVASSARAEEASSSSGLKSAGPRGSAPGLAGSPRPRGLGIEGPFGPLAHGWDKAAPYGSGASGAGGDMTWFHCGLRIGVGVGLGVCLGLGLGVGILLRSYQTLRTSARGITARVFA